MILGRHKISLFDLKFLNIPIINSERLKKIRMANDQISLIEFCLIFLNRSPLKLNALQMGFNFIVIKSDDFHGIIVERCRKICLRRGRKGQISNSIADSADKVLVLRHKMPLHNNSLNSS